MCCDDSVALITGIALIIAGCSTTDELELLAASLLQLSDTLANIATRRRICCENEENKPDLNNTRDQINCIREEFIES